MAKDNVIRLPVRHRAAPVLSEDERAEREIEAVLLWLDGRGSLPFDGPWELMRVNEARFAGLIEGDSKDGHRLTDSGRTWLRLRGVR